MSDELNKLQPWDLPVESQAFALKTSYEGPIKEADEWRPLAQHIRDCVAPYQQRIAELEAERDSIRDKALEEAATIVDDAPSKCLASHEAAAAIRALKGGKG